MLPTEIEVRTAPASLSYPGDAQFSYEVELTTGGQPVHIGIFWTTPEWPGGWEFEGTPLELKQPTLLGPGEMRDPREFFVNFQLDYGIVGACLRGRARNRTYDADGRELHLPANSTATLRAPAKLTSGPWPAIDYSPAFEIFRISPAGVPLTDSVRLRAPRVSFGGSSGVYIRTRARDKRGLFRPLARSPRLAGTTNPPLRNQPIQLRAVRLPGHSSFRNVSLGDWGKKRTRKLGVVRTDASGRFRLKRRRLPPGSYRVLARYQGGQAGVTPDWNCGPLFRVGRRGRR